MKYRNVLRIGQIRKWNVYVTNLANTTISPTLRIMINSSKIHNRKNGQTLQKGTDHA